MPHKGLCILVWQSAQVAQVCIGYIHNTCHHLIMLAMQKNGSISCSLSIFLSGNAGPWLKRLIYMEIRFNCEASDHRPNLPAPGLAGTHSQPHYWCP